ncbi:MAG TPA: hypothetical protein VF329_01345 [Gammaproteobacteria bacterium]
MPSFRPTGRGALLAGAAAASWLAASIAAAQSPPAHPDFSGIWFPSFGRDVPDPLPFTEAALQLKAQYEAAFTVDDDPGRYCIWPGMPRAPWGAPFPIEIIHRPQDVTMYWEGYGMYRKIYMEGHAPPVPPLPSAMGYSVAHWEDDTLVVDTTNLKPYPYMTRLATTSDAHVVERLTMVEREADGERRKYLVDDIVLTDPKMYTEPVRIRAEAVLRPDLQMLEYTCTDVLWDEYLQERGLTLPDVDALPASAED